MLKKLSRRRFFAAAAGAAAAPALSQSVQAVPALPPPTMPTGYDRYASKGYGLGERTAPMVDPMYMARERARLEAIARGELEDHQSYQVDVSSRHFRAEAGAANIEGLRSVSQPVKRLMYAAHTAERQRRDYVAEAAHQLRRMLKGGAW